MVSASGLTVGIRPRPHGNGTDPSVVAAYQGAALKWTRPISVTCGQSPVAIGYGQLVPGADGNIYGAGTAYTNCGRQAVIFGISATTGALLFANRSADASGIVGAYRRGLVVENYAGDGVRYIDYHGNDIGRVRVVSAAAEMPQRLAVNPDGYVFAYLTNRSGPTSKPDCWRYDPVNRLDVFNISGRTGRYTLPYCADPLINAWTAASWGVPVLLTVTQAGSSTDRLIAVDPRGHLLFTRTVPERDDARDRAYAPVAVQADSRGHIVLLRNVTYNAYTSTSFQVDTYSHTTGAPVDSFDTSALDSGAGGNSSQYALAEGRLYVEQVQCTAPDGLCGTWQTVLVSMPRPGLGMDEPRATLLKSSAALPAPVSTVALGDSYSSGEGNPPFDAASHACDRSPQAWPRLLAVDDAAVHLVAHLACSGAEISALSSTFKGEPAQVTTRLRSLRPAPSLVTLTIGGNDVGFSRILTHCFLSDCVLDRTVAHARSYISQTLPGKLLSAYQLVKTTAPHARVVVVGYPRLFPAQQSATRRCRWLTPSERSNLNDLAAQMDAATRAAAARAHVTYVSVLNSFDGHELCSASPWVYDVGRNGGDNRGHPLPAGQRAIESAVRRVIDAV
ncbi:SGNH/GDSL hydrolase family protein [Streptomyces sp. NPDC087422]|uniref:SGNH/GDSL hydrolase family protein n=1 Tax=Streptomyces sp. NPDC087422 TaxID=3365786 RepID=UPI0038242B54